MIKAVLRKIIFLLRAARYTIYNMYTSQRRFRYTDQQTPKEEFNVRFSEVWSAMTDMYKATHEYDY